VYGLSAKPVHHGKVRDGIKEGGNKQCQGERTYPGSNITYPMTRLRQSDGVGVRACNPDSAAEMERIGYAALNDFYNRLLEPTSYRFEICHRTDKKQ
jgi:hypothetical protein